MTLRIGSMFSGYLGLDLAVESMIDARTAWVADIDPGACKVLAHRLPDVPNLGDVTSIDWADVEPVDIITGGYPCQPFSMAGRRKGQGDERHLWPYVRDALAVLRPTFAVFENVRGHLTLGFKEVVRDLHQLNYDVEWRLLRASDVGACHQRARLFILGVNREQRVCSRTHRRGAAGRCADCGLPLGLVVGAGGQLVRPGGVRGEVPNEREDDLGPRVRAASGADVLARRRDAANPYDAGLQGQCDPAGAAPARRYGHAESGAGGLDLVTLPTPRATDGTKGGPNQRGSSGDLMLPSAVAQLPTPRATRGGSSTETAAMLPTPKAGDAQFDLPRTSGRPPEKSTHLATRLHYTDFGQYAVAVARQEAAFGYPAPSPTEPGKSRPRLSAEFASWMMGLPPGWITDVPGVTRNEALRMAGNGVVPQQAAAALRDMLPHAIAALTGRAA